MYYIGQLRPNPAMAEIKPINMSAQTIIIMGIGIEFETVSFICLN